MNEDVKLSLSILQRAMGMERIGGQLPVIAVELERVGGNFTANKGRKLLKRAGISCQPTEERGGVYI